MLPDEKRSESMLDAALQAIRNDKPDAAAEEAAVQRAWARISQPAASAAEPVRIRGCAGFQALLPAFRAGTLAPPRMALVQDHLHECVACRKAHEAASAKVAPFPARLVARKPAWLRFPALQWAAAAALVVALTLSAWMAFQYMAPSPFHSQIAVQSVDGLLYRVGQEVATLAPGEEVPGGSEIRTAKDSRAVVRLSDGSLVELNERSQLKVSATRRDTTVHLERGAIIVQAAHRAAGHLFVSTRDCRVAVTGTVFSVSSGLKGSRVTVIEGEVEVTQGRDEKVLRPGEQTATSPGMEPVAVREEIAWSAQLEQHLALLGEFTALGRRLEAIRLPGLRYSSPLLEMAPSSTVVFASMPNLSEALGQAQAVFEQRLQESPVLRQWWEEHTKNAKPGARPEDILRTVQMFSNYLGDEVVMLVPEVAPGKSAAPVFLAEVKTAGLRAFLETELARLAAPGEQPKVRIVDALPPATAESGRELLILVRPGLVAISPDARSLSQVLASVDGAAGGRFAGTPLYSRIAAAYRNGAGFLLAADLERLGTAEGRREGNTRREHGFENAKYFLAEQKEVEGKTQIRAALGFDGPRQGLASWLARPAAIGALDYVSPEAMAAAAFVTRKPAEILDEILAMEQAGKPGDHRDIEEFQAKTGIDVRNDLAAAFGGEFALAFDGSLLPTPAWKFVAEVYDPAALESTIRKLVDAANREAAERGRGSVTLEEHVADGRRYYSITVPEAKKLVEIHYTLDGGYLIAAPSRALLDKAISYRSSGSNLARSAAFTSLLPRDPQANFSGVLYQNIGPLVAPVAEGVGAAAQLTPEQRQAVQQISAQMKATLLALYGEEDQIVMAANGNLFSLGINNLLGMRGAGMLAQLLGNAQGKGTSAQRQAR